MNAAPPDSAADRWTCHVSDPLWCARGGDERTRRTEARTAAGGPREAGRIRSRTLDGRKDGRNSIRSRLSQSWGRPVLVVFLPFGVDFEMHSLLGHHR